MNLQQYYCEILEDPEARQEDKVRVFDITNQVLTEFRKFSDYMMSGSPFDEGRDK